MARAKVGIIGGSGLYQMPDLTDVEHVEIETPFGSPSDSITVGTLSDVRVAFLPRHGRYHQFGPANVPVRANIWALKMLGVSKVISVSAVGSMREDLRPLDFVVPDQLFDRTIRGDRTLFDDFVVHVSLADPFCSPLRDAIVKATRRTEATVHDGGTYVCIEGPQFSTKGESRIFRSWGVDVIGMTAMPEARLAREAELCYAMLAMVTDYDVWHDTEASVTVQAVIANLRQNVANAQAVVKGVVPLLSQLSTCDCGSALQHAITTHPDGISAESKERFGLLLNRYLAS